ncbi:uncharacterized protein AC631_02628 [Debaryomyces fabryi]|uniref:Mediator of RNA polymerase II transcription subunit 9 n=1 Tax=Debaryomyces fabryi TaxID=58627 RepID=A0A0V1PZK5_9ASCO|nr:uncharacterized protein AC631_02628 [Debaryomyces fabryi]KSA01619.1 hypothetical protein AC631_02628 [Debaryomyces fabryi]CUM47164.1 unnamed protein product [Debaryomyces fabryi]
MSSPKALSPKIKTPRELSPSAEDRMKKSSSSNKVNSETRVARSASPDVTSKDAMDIDSEENNLQEERDPLQKLQTTELLPDLYNLLNDLQNGHILAKDFDNNAGSIRLKLSKMKENLQNIPGINESVKARETKIQNLKLSNEKKLHFLNRFKQKVESELGESST